MHSIFIIFLQPIDSFGMMPFHVYKFDNKGVFMSYPLTTASRSFSTAAAAAAHPLKSELIPAYDPTQTFSHGLCVYTCLFIQYAQQEALKGSFYDLSSKALLVLTGLSTLIEANIRIALHLLVKVIDFVTAEIFETIHEQAQDPLKEVDLARALSADSFAALSAPETLTEKFLAYAGPLAADIRENRVRFEIDDAAIQRKITKEALCAKLQMETDFKYGFQYKTATANFPPADPQQLVGPCHVGVYSYQGRRLSMEDEHLVANFSLPINGHDYLAELFAVFDGHGGKACATFIKNNFQEQLCKTLLQFNAQGLTDKGIWNALKITFVALNKAFKKAFPTTETSGTTACVVLFLDGKMWTANAGDSRALLENNGVSTQLSEDAKPTDKRFVRAVHRRGATILFRGIHRVDGILATARALGDRQVRGVTARPKITMIPLSEVAPGSHLVIACDGLFDVASSKQVATAVHDHKEAPANELAKNLVFSAYEAKSTDNLSTIVIKFP